MCMTNQEFKDWVSKKGDPIMWKDKTSTRYYFLEIDGRDFHSTYIDFRKLEKSGTCYCRFAEKGVNPLENNKKFENLFSSEKPTCVNKDYIEGMKNSILAIKNAQNPYIDDIIDIPETLFINEKVKLKVGGRTAPQISLDDFKNKISVYDLYDIFSLPKVEKDLNKVLFDFENYEDFGYGVTSFGVPYLKCWAGGDWEVPVMFFIYWDGKSLRAYIPTKGNTFRADCKVAFGSEEEKGETEESSYLYIIKECLPNLVNKYKDDKKLIDLAYSGDLTSRLEFQETWCLEDFESRLKP